MTPQTWQDAATLRHTALLAADAALARPAPAAARGPALLCGLRAVRSVVPGTRRGSRARQMPSTLQTSMLCLRKAC